MTALAAAFPTTAPASGPLHPARRRLPSFLRPVPKPPRPAAEPYRVAGVEPALEDLLNDPLVHLILARDGLTVADVRAQMESARRRLRNR